MAVIKRIKTIFQFRRGTTEEWGSNKDMTPAAGEPCYDLNLKTLRIGDGVTTYENLPVVGGVELASDGKSLVMQNGAMALAGFDAAEIGAYPRKSADGELEWVIAGTGDTSELQAEIESLKSSMEILQADIDNVETNVGGLQEQVGDTDVAAMQENMTQVTENVANLTTQIEATNTEIITVKETLETKADVETVTELQTIVETKVDTEAVEILETELKTYVDEQIKNIEAGDMDGGVIE